MLLLKYGNYITISRKNIKNPVNYMILKDFPT